VSDSVHVLSRENVEFKKLVDDLATADRLTLVIGAGAAMDAGLLPWRGLVRTFLETGFKKAADARHIQLKPDESYESLAEVVIATQDVLRAATIGRYLHGDQREAAIKEALYHLETERPRPGRILKAIGALAHSMGTKLRIITTNYDDLIEHELETSADVPIRVFTNSPDDEMKLVSGDPDGEAIEIYHLHGFAPFDGEPQGTLILDDEDYAIMPVKSPGEILPKILGDGPTLFIGLSMTDPDLVAACYQATAARKAGSPPPWHGLFVGRSMEIPDNLAKYLKRVLREMGIHPLDLASYGQISQVIYELIRRLADKEKYWADKEHARYSHRFMAWHTGIHQKFRYVHGGDDYQTTQTILHDGLNSLLEEVCTHHLSDRSGPERLALHLWVREPGPELGTLALWASSAHFHREGWSLKAQSYKVVAHSGISAVDVVYHSAIHVRNQSDSNLDRWQAIVGIPIELIQREYENVIVGVITISSTVPLYESVLEERTDSAIAAIHEWGANTLNPLIPRAEAAGTGPS